MKQHRDKLRAGDKVILWQSGDEAGIYAFGELADKPHKSESEWRVDIQYKPSLRQPLFKRDLEKHLLLSDLGVLKMLRGRNPFPVTETEWQALQELISKGYRKHIHALPTGGEPNHQRVRRPLGLVFENWRTTVGHISPT